MPPFAFHHYRQPVNNDVEETADREAYDKQAYEVNGRVLLEYR